MYDINSFINPSKITSLLGIPLKETNHNIYITLQQENFFVSLEKRL